MCNTNTYTALSGQNTVKLMVLLLYLLIGPYLLNETPLITIKKALLVNKFYFIIPLQLIFTCYTL